MCFHHDAQISSILPKRASILALRQSKCIQFNAPFIEYQGNGIQTNIEYTQKGKSTKATEQGQCTVPGNTENYRNRLSRREEKELKRNSLPYGLF